MRIVGILIETWQQPNNSTAEEKNVEGGTSMSWNTTMSMKINRLYTIFLTLILMAVFFSLVRACFTFFLQAFGASSFFTTTCCVHWVLLLLIFSVNHLTHPSFHPSHFVYNKIQSLHDPCAGRKLVETKYLILFFVLFLFNIAAVDKVTTENGRLQSQETTLNWVPSRSR